MNMSKIRLPIFAKKGAKWKKQAGQGRLLFFPILVYNQGVRYRHSSKAMRTFCPADSSRVWIRFSPLANLPAYFW